MSYGPNVSLLRGLHDRVHLHGQAGRTGQLLTAPCLQRAFQRLSGVMSMKARVGWSHGPCFPELSGHVSGKHFNPQTGREHAPPPTSAALRARLAPRSPCDRLAFVERVFAR